MCIQNITILLDPTDFCSFEINIFCIIKTMFSAFDRAPHWTSLHWILHHCHSLYYEILALTHTVLNYTWLHCTDIQFNGQHWISLHITKRHFSCWLWYWITLGFARLCPALHYTALGCAPLYCTALNSTSLHFNTLHRIAMS